MGKKKKTKNNVEATEATEPVAAEAKEGLIRRLLSSRSDETFVRFAYFFPFICGALSQYGFFISELILFSAFLGVLITSDQLRQVNSGSVPLKKEFALGVLYGATILLLFVIYGLTNNFPAVALLIFVVVSSVVRGKLPKTSIGLVLLHAGLVTLEMSAFPILGVFSQTKTFFLEMWPLVAFGFTPGLILASSEVVGNLDVFLKSSWQRSKLTKNKKGEEVLRPGGIAQLFSLLFVLGPTVAVGFVFFEKAPAVFWVYALPMLRMPTIAESFLKQTKTDQCIYRAIIQLAALTSALNFVIILLFS